MLPTEPERKRLKVRLHGLCKIAPAPLYEHLVMNEIFQTFSLATEPVPSNQTTIGFIH